VAHARVRGLEWCKRRDNSIVLSFISFHFLFPVSLFKSTPSQPLTKTAQRRVAHQSTSEVSTYVRIRVSYFYFFIFTEHTKLLFTSTPTPMTGIACQFEIESEYSVLHGSLALAVAQRSRSRGLSLEGGASILP
jgi:hypothetical protein